MRAPRRRRGFSRGSLNQSSTVPLPQVASTSSVGNDVIDVEDDAIVIDYDSDLSIDKSRIKRKKIKSLSKLFGVGIRRLDPNSKAVCTYICTPNIPRSEFIDIVDIKGVTVSDHMMLKLGCEEQLSSAIIDATAAALGAEYKANNNKANWYLPVLKDVIIGNGDGVKAWLRSGYLNYFAFLGRVKDCQKIFVPLHENKRGHFCLLVVDNVERACFVFDTLRRRNGIEISTKRCASKLLEGLDDVYRTKEDDHAFRLYDIKSHPNCPKQENGYDCGPMVINLMRDLPDAKSGKAKRHLNDPSLTSEETRLRILLWLFFHPENKLREEITLEAVQWMKKNKT